MRHLLVAFVLFCSTAFAGNGGVLAGGVDGSIYGAALSVSDTMKDIAAKDIVGTKDIDGKTITAVEVRDDAELSEEITKLEQDIPDRELYCQAQCGACQAHVDDMKAKLEKLNPKIDKIEALDVR